MIVPSMRIDTIPKAIRENDGLLRDELNLLLLTTYQIVNHPSLMNCKKTGIDCLQMYNPNELSIVDGTHFH